MPMPRFESDRFGETRVNILDLTIVYDFIARKYILAES